MRLRTLALLAACAVSLLGTGVALADDAMPVITAKPEISGVAQEGATLTASATWTGSPEPVAQWTWRRCAADSSCKAIRGASANTYVVTASDVGQRLQARLTVTNSLGTDDARSKPTDVVTAAPVPEPTPTPTPEPSPTPAPTPAPDPPAFDVAPAPAMAPAASQPAKPHAPRLLDPFPLIRIKGVLTARGARLTLLTVRAPRGARIDVVCAGRSCPMPKYARSAAVSRLRPFERGLRGGTRLELSVTKPGFVGKWTSIVIRVGLVPRRRDGCLDSDTKRHVRCPA